MIVSEINFVLIYSKHTEDNVFENKNLCVIHEEKDKDTEVEGKVLVEGKDSIEGNHDVNEEKKKSEAEEGAGFIVQLQSEK